MRNVFTIVEPVIVIDANVGDKLLLVSDKILPLVGKVTFVVPVEVIVVAYAPDVVKFPPNVIVFDELFTPVPPYVGEIIVPFHVPDVIVPIVEISVPTNLFDANLKVVKRPFLKLFLNSCGIGILMLRGPLNV